MIARSYAVSYQEARDVGKESTFMCRHFNLRIRFCLSVFSLRKSLSGKMKMLFLCVHLSLKNYRMKTRQESFF